MFLNLILKTPLPISIIIIPALKKISQIIAIVKNKRESIPYLEDTELIPLITTSKITHPKINRVSIKSILYKYLFFLIIGLSPFILKYFTNLILSIIIFWQSNLPQYDKVVEHLLQHAPNQEIRHYA